MASALPDPKHQRGTTATKAVGGALFDGAAGGGHPASLYAFDSIIEPVRGLAAVGENELQQFHDAGFIAVEGAFAQSQVEAAERALENQILGGNSKTAVQFEAWAAGALDRLDAADRLRAARKLTRFADADPSLAALAQDPQMLGIVSQLMGGSEPKLLQEMALLKAPGGREKPWHQDRAYFNVHPDDPIIGVWIALDEATPENGCMRLWPGRHHQGPIAHFQLRDWQICDREVGAESRVAVPLKPGGVLFFHPLLPHGTPANDTPDRRWAIQLHFHAVDARLTDDDARLEVFGAEGKNVEC